MKVEEVVLKIKNQEQTYVKGVGLGEQAYLLSKLDMPIFFVATDEESALKMSKQLESLGVKNVCLNLSLNEFVLSKFQSKDNIYKVVNCLTDLKNQETKVVVGTFDCLNLKLGKVEDFKTIKLEVGKTYSIENLVQQLICLGYKRVDVVESYGEFALRGDLLDVFAPNHSYPVRINFFDEEIETIYYFDNINLVRIKDLAEIVVAPNKLICFTADKTKEIQDKFKQIYNKTQDENLIDVGAMIEKEMAPEFLPLFDEELAGIADYLKNPVVVFQSLFVATNRMEKYKQETLKKLEMLFENKEIVEKIFKNINFDLKTNIDDRKYLFFENSMNDDAGKICELKTKKLSNYLNNLKLIKNDFLTSELQNKTIKLCLDNPHTLQNIKEIFLNLNISFSTNPKSKGFVLTCDKIPFNICFQDEDIWIVGSTNFAHKKELEKSSTKKLKFLPKSGEYVVHEVHGIGLCEGVVTLNVMGADKDFFKIQYAKGDTLYLPTENTDSLSLYMGATDVKLNKLGGKEFALTKAKTEKVIEEMAKDLLELYAKRAQAKGFKYSEDNYLMTEFENSFPHTETVDQAQAIEDIKRDMQAGKVMDRLVCGDVGYGKTEVAIRASFKTFLEGKQIAVLAPTTILSLQHYNTFKKRCAEFGVKIEMLNRFRSLKQREEILTKLRNGEIDIICGTHSLLSDGVEFKDLGLLVLDEEQRFGVKAKEKLKNLKHNVNVLTLSATPIPRTLNMAMLTLRDISIINTPPKDRLPVKTYVCPFDFGQIVSAIEKEYARGGQILIVYNDVEKIFSLASNLKSKLNNEAIKFDVAHGKMTKTELENAIKRLYDNQTDVFVSTTLIENGVDLPRANTLIVVDSQNLGLSQMYQLRGRVGRSDEQAYAYFTYPKERTITIEATDRLEALAENTELGSGFKIAMRDLQLRGAGELLGKEQHGHMVKVGYDLYVKLLEETIKKLKGEKVEVLKDVKIDISINAKLPNSFVEDETEKLKIYAKISNITDINSQKQIVEGLKENYGKLPKEVLQLTNVSLIKALAQKIGIKHLIVNKDNYSIVFYKDCFDLDKILKMFEKFSKFSLLKAEMPTIRLNPKEFSPETAQGYIIEFLNKYIQNNEKS